jgi:WD40 repeat protein
LTVWDAASGLEKLSLTVPPEKPSPRVTTGPIVAVEYVAASMAYSPDGRRLIAATGGSSVTMWDVTTGQETVSLRGHAGQVLGGAFSPDGQRIVTGSADKTVKLWDVQTGQETLTLQGHKSLVWGVAFSGDGQRIVSADHNGTVRVWEAPLTNADPQAPR